MSDKETNPAFLDEDGNPKPRAILPLTFKAIGCNFTQLAREGKVAIYQRIEIESKVPSFEVVIIQGHDGRVIKGSIVQPSEFYPSTSSWGILGWSYTRKGTDPDRAWAKYEELKARFAPKVIVPARRRIPLAESAIAEANRINGEIASLGDRIESHQDANSANS